MTLFLFRCCLVCFSSLSFFLCLVLTLIDEVLVQGPAVAGAAAPRVREVRGAAGSEGAARFLQGI